MEKVRMLVLSFTLANFADYLTTVFGLQMGFQEVNSIVASLNPFLFLMLKFLIILTISAALLLSRNFGHSLVRGVYIGLIAGVVISTVFITVVAAHNFLLLAGFSENEILVRVVSQILI
ncbi:DUF5658 family protein [Archaeoglobus sp.]